MQMEHLFGLGTVSIHWNEENTLTGKFDFPIEKPILMIYPDRHTDDYLHTIALSRLKIGRHVIPLGAPLTIDAITHYGGIRLYSPEYPVLPANMPIELLLRNNDGCMGRSVSAAVRGLVDPGHLGFPTTIPLLTPDKKP